MGKKVLLLLAAAVFCLPASAQTADEVIAKYVQAIGGMDKLKAVNSMRITGKIAFGSIEAPFTRYSKRPDKVRIDAVVQGTTATFLAYDGKIGWTLVPFSGNKNAEPMGGDDLREAQEEADFDGPLVDYKDKGNTVELLGKDDVEGAPAYKIKVTLKNGDTSTAYIDADSYLEVRDVSTRTINGNQREIQTDFGDYKPVEGVLYPFTFEGGPVGGDPNQKQKVTVDKIEVNVPIEDSFFTMPPPAPAAPAPEAKPPESKPPAGR